MAGGRLMRWGVTLADVTLLLVAATATHAGAGEPADPEAAAVQTFALAYAPGSADSADLAALPSWIAREADDGALELVLTASVDAADRRTGAGLPLAAARAEAVLPALGGRPAEVRLSGDGVRRVTVSLRYR